VSGRAKTLGVLVALPIRLILFPFIFPRFLSFFTDMESRTRLGGWKGVDRLASPCRLKNIGSDVS
jgi:hypothetical protein